MRSTTPGSKPEFVRPNVARTRLLELIAALPPCVIGMEACSGAHHWARLFMAHGHTVRLMAPKFVSPYRLSGKRGKNDAADAAAICEAVQRPNMRFVPIKSQEQQSRLSVHRVRQGASLALDLLSWVRLVPQRIPLHTSQASAVISGWPPASCCPAPWTCSPRRGRSCRRRAATRDTSDRYMRARPSPPRLARPAP